MKKLFIICCICGICGIICANDTIPILNTVFHGINTLVNITKPTVVVTPTPTTTTIITPTVVTTPTPIIVQEPIVVNQLPQVIYVNGTYRYVYPNYQHKYYRHPPKHIRKVIYEHPTAKKPKHKSNKRR